MENTTPVSETTETSKQKLSSVGALLKQTIEIYKTGFKKFLGLQLVPILAFLPLAVMVGAWLLASFTIKATNALMIANVVLGLLGIIALLFGIYLAVLSQVGIFMLLKDFKVERTFKEILVSSKPYVLNFIGTSFMVGIVALIGFVLLIVPGIIWTVVYAFAVYVLIFEGLSGWQAMKRSKELVKNYWWPVALRSLVVFAVSIIISFPSAFFQENSTSEAVYGGIAGLIKFIITPAFVIYSYLIYKELVKIKTA